MYTLGDNQIRYFSKLVEFTIISSFSIIIPGDVIKILSSYHVYGMDLLVNTI
jgi:hypothetical protein